MKKSCPQEKFLAKSKKTHGDTYGYEEAIYTKSTAPVVIICRKHGRFSQIAAEHIRGRGCPHCANEKKYQNLFKCINGEKRIPKAGLRKDTAKFIQEAKGVHGDVNDYSETEYLGSQKPVTIICRKHGRFVQIASEHLRGRGCPKCGRNCVSISEFKKRVNKKHRGKYDLEKVVYKKLTDKVIIVCPLHGDFLQVARNHMKGQGCPKCASNAAYSNEIFRKKSEEQHGPTYGYERSVYRGAQEEVEITCGKHGSFFQIAASHWNGQGCPKCAGLNLSNEEYIALVDEVHEGKYLYTATTYMGGKYTITVTCPTHGDFQQKASTHRHGAGCPKCHQPKGERKVAAVLKKLNVQYVPQKTFEDCINPKTGRKLRFDFYLPEQDKTIEYDGESHFSPWRKYWDKEKAVVAFQEAKYRDALKDEYFKGQENKFLRIHYKQYKQVEKILNQFLGK